MNKNVINMPERQKILALGPLYTIKELFTRSASYHGAKNVVCEKEKGSLVYKSAADIRSDYTKLASALIDLGLEGKNIAIVSENSYKYIVVYAAVTCGVGTIVPIDKELKDEDIVKLINEADCEAVFCSRTFVKMLSSSCEKMPKVKHIIVTDCEYDGEKVVMYSDLLKRGEELILSGDRRADEHSVYPDDVAAILFTSGTTGANKGVMLTHRNITSNINDILVLIPDEPTSISILPMNHSFEFNCHILPAIYVGMTVCINSSLRYVMSDIKLYRPYMTVVVPLFVEAIYRSIADGIEKSGQKNKVKRGIFLSKILLKMGIDARRSIFKSVIQSFGGNFYYMVCGGAPVNPETVKKLYELGFDISIGYGMTECSPIISVNREAGKNAYNVGLPVPSTEVGINNPDDDGIGEIMIRGDKIASGYYKDERSYKESFYGDWFLTGDFGKIDKNGNVYVTGRKKSLIILDNGKNVYPEEIEAFVSEKLPYVKEIIVHESPVSHGKGGGAVAATVYIDMKKQFENRRSDEAEVIVKEDMREVNRLLPAYKQIRYVYISSDELPKTSTGKIIRERTAQSMRHCKKIKI